MLRVYFDTNVYDRIDKQTIPQKELDALRAALHERKLIAHVSTSNLEELHGEWETDRRAVVRKLRIVNDLVGYSHLFKPPEVLLKEAIYAYACGDPPPSPMLPQELVNLSTKYVQGVLNGDKNIDQTASTIVRGTNALKDTFLDQITQACDEVRSTLHQTNRRDLRLLDINWFWNSEAKFYAETLARSLELDDACRRRGLDGLLNVQPVRFCVGALIAYIFSTTVGYQGQPRAPIDSDQYDLWHAIMASTADACVTYDGDFAKSLRRVPLDGFSVFSSLSDLLAEVD
jgi:hypothetical protein